MNDFKFTVIIAITGMMLSNDPSIAGNMDKTPLEKTPQNTVSVYFAGGCFWGTEFYFQDIKGIVGTRVGYMGGSTKNPSYIDVSRGNTGHAETVEVTFDSSRVSYEDLVKLFFEIHDPTQINRQGLDYGEQYRSVIFYGNESQKKMAGNLMTYLEESGLELATQLIPVKTFYEAEAYHQGYYKKLDKTPICHIYENRFD